MSIDERIVDSDVRMRRADVADTTHVGSEVIDFIDVFGRPYAFGIIPKIRDDEFVSVRCFVFRSFDVDTAHDVSTFDEILDEMVADKSARTGNQNRRLISHGNRS
jgi:hypothetical protein